MQNRFLLSGKTEEEYIDKIMELDSLVDLLKEKIGVLEAELARLKKVPGHPKIQPNKVEKEKKRGSPRTSQKKPKNLVPTETITLEVPQEELPVGSRYNGCEEYIYQELVIGVKVVKFMRKQYRLPDGTTKTAPLPEYVNGRHYGPVLCAYVVNQHHKNNVPQEKIVEDLKDKGVEISAGTVNKILEDAATALRGECDAIFEVGKKTSKVIAVDDTTARHQGRNGFCTAVNGDYFAYFKSSSSKSRISFLETLHGDEICYALNDYSLQYLKKYNVHKRYLDLLCPLHGLLLDTDDWYTLANPIFEKSCAGKGVKRRITEAALLGGLIEQGMPKEIVLLSDGAQQYNLFNHALCWIHVGRVFKKMVPKSEEEKVERDALCDQFWEYYRKLADYCRNNKRSDNEAVNLSTDFDSLVSQRVESENLAVLLRDMASKKEQLLQALYNQGVPLHNNGTESVIRAIVIKRKISGGTRSNKGRDARDVFASLVRTCRKNKISFWKFINSRLHGDATVPYLPSFIRNKNSARAAITNTIQ